MDELKQNLIKKAIEKHQKIKPCGNKPTLSDCFTEHGDKLIFWYNTEDDNTCILYENVNFPPLIAC